MSDLIVAAYLPPVDVYFCRAVWQLLLDTHSLKTVLLELPSLGSQVSRKAPAR